MPQRFGRYELLDLLGRGGMGEVYRARDTERQRDVALKVLPEHLAGDAKFMARFRRESRLAAQLSDPHIIPIHDFGEIDGRLYIDMRLVVGSDLSSVLEEQGGLAARVAVDILTQVASALDAAHAEGLLHRDVKPSNVMLTGLSSDLVERPPFAYLVDFGIARSNQQMTVLTETSSAAMGTVAYMAPERIGGEVGDARADVYALACVLYESLTAALPFEGEVVSMIYQHMSADPPRASAHVTGVPLALDDVISRGMAKAPDDRYASAGDLAVAARRAILTSSSGSAAAPPRRRPAVPAPPRPPRPAPGRQVDPAAGAALRRPHPGVPAAPQSAPPGSASSAPSPRSLRDQTRVDRAPWAQPVTRTQTPVRTVTLWLAAPDRHTRLTGTGTGAATATDTERRDALRGLWATHGGVETESDGLLLAVFDDPSQALTAAAEAQHHGVTGAGGAGLRIGVHTVEVDARGAYWPAELDYVQHLAAAARGGQVLVSATTRTRASAHAVAPLGAHSLPGFPTARPIYHLVVDDSSPDDFPPPRTFDPPRPSVPTPSNAMIGRDDELAELARLITGAALVTLIGSAGVGKTRLATEAAHRVAPRFESVWFVGLDAVAEAADVVPAIARALGLPELAGVDPLERLIENLRGRRVLLVLDHVEHVIDVAPAIASLVAADRAIHVLVTSQAPLQLADERVVRLGPLETPEPDVLDPAAITSTAAVQLLLARAGGRGTGLVVDDGTARDLAQLSRRVEGIPLAIGLAAAGLADTTPAELVQRWDADESGRGMSGVLDWSVGRLTATQHRLLVLLSAFPDGFSPALARSAFGGADGGGDSDGDIDGDIDGDLRTLVAAGLVYPVEDGRFRMWAPVRRFGEHAAAAEGGDPDAGPRGVATAILRAAEATEANWILDEGDGRLRLGADTDTIVASMSWARQRAPQLHAELASAAAWFLSGRGHAEFSRAQLELAAGESQDDRSRARRLQAHGLLADTAAGRTDHGEPAGPPVSVQAADLWHVLGEADPEATSLAQAAMSFTRSGQTQQALGALDRAALLGPRTSNPAGAAWLVELLRADAMSGAGQDDEAAALCAHALDAVEVGSLRHVRAATVAARIARRGGRADDALELCGVAMQGLAPFATILGELELAETVALVLLDLDRVVEAAAVLAICAAVHADLSWPVPTSIAAGREQIRTRIEPERHAAAEERAKSYRTAEGLAWIARLARGESDAGRTGATR